MGISSILLFEKQKREVKVEALGNIVGVSNPDPHLANSKKAELLTHGEQNRLNR